MGDTLVTAPHINGRGAVALPDKKNDVWCSPTQTLQHGVLGNEVECPCSINGHHCCRDLIRTTLATRGHTLAANSRGKRVLERCGHRFNHFAHLLGNDPRHILRTTSPDTMSLIPPLGFVSAVNLPILTITLCGAFPVANCSPTKNNMYRSLTLSNNGLRWSVVIPDGPASAPLLAERKFFENDPSLQLQCGGWLKLEQFPRDILTRTRGASGRIP